VDGHQVWVFVHILLLVYWLGADVGVFVLARMSKDAKLSVETRAKLLQAALAVDLLPRLCFALMVPVGLHLAVRLGLIAAPAWLEPAAWAYALLWCGLLLRAPAWEGKPAAARFRQANLTVQGLLGAGFIGAGALSLGGAGPILAPWLAQKAILFGLCYPAAIMIDVAFQPGVAAFGAIATQGSTPEREQIFARSVDATCAWVVAVYALVALAAFWGTVQPG
jgi:hypothetical protein